MINRTLNTTASPTDLQNERSQAEDRLIDARKNWDSLAEARAMVDLLEVAYLSRDFRAIVKNAESAWTIAERESQWELLTRLAIVFADLSLDTSDYNQAFDHYANACAFAISHGQDSVVRALARIDEVIFELISTNRGARARQLCYFLLAYEANGGLGDPSPDLAAHFLSRLEQVGESDYTGIPAAA